MAYVTQHELEVRMCEVRLVDCTDDDADGAPDLDVVAAVVDDASGIADGYLQTAGYAVPLGAPTPALRHHVASIAAHFAASRRQEYRDARGAAPYRTEYADALAWLEKVAAGKILLEARAPDAGHAGGPSIDEASPSGMVLHSYRGQRPPPAGVRRMRGW